MANRAAINFSALNNGSEDEIFKGVFLTVEQMTGRIHVGEFLEIEQEVEFHEVFEGVFLDIEQETETVFEGTFLRFLQVVRDLSVPTMLEKRKWDAHIYIDGALIPHNQIHGPIRIERQENMAALMEVTIIPPKGIQDLIDYHGKSIHVDVETLTDGIVRVYTGTVDIPEVNFIEKKITLRCTDDRSKLINAQLGSVVKGIGYYSVEVFGEVQSLEEELSARLSTVPLALDFDAYGVHHITPWKSKENADFNFDAKEVYYFEPRVVLSGRGRVVNKINLNIGYRYNRLHHHERSFGFVAIGTDICSFLLSGMQLPTRSMILGAAQGTGWPIKGGINFGDIPLGGWYRCGTNVIGWTRPMSSTSSTIVKTEDQLGLPTGVSPSGEFGKSLDFFLNPEPGDPVLDADGKEVTQHIVHSTTDYSGNFASGAAWIGTTRWAQTVTEQYSLTIEAPQSISRYGTIEQDVSLGVTAISEDTEWENYTSYRPPVPGWGAIQASIFLDQDVNRKQYNHAVITAINQAKTSILETHRTTSVFIDKFVFPKVDLQHTVEIDTHTLRCKGKVRKVIHTLDVVIGEAKTNIELAISLSGQDEAASESSIFSPKVPQDSVTYPSSSITFGTFLGIDPNTSDEAGFFTNWFNPQSGWTSISPQIRFDSPPIPSTLRDEKVRKSSSVGFDIDIPNDDLEVEF
jgi:hypothetical protein